MSEYKRSLVLLEQVETTIATLQEQLQATSQDLRHDYEALRDTMEHRLLPLIPKFEKRLAEVDPVTQTPRYGPKMKANIEALLPKLIALREPYEALAEPIQQRHDQLSIIAQQDHDRQVAQDRARCQAKRQAEAQEQQEQRDKQRQQEQATKQKLDQLHQQAEQLRDQRQQDREEIIRNCTNDSAGLRYALARLQQRTTIQQFQDAKATLLHFLENILKAPENPQFRQIKQQNAAYQERLGQFDEDLCLRALGFQLVEEQDEFVYHMAEPPLTMDQLDAWDQWYNNLKAMTVLLTNDGTKHQ